MRMALSTQSIVTRRYLLEPGDGTRYNFMIHWFSPLEPAYQRGMMRTASIFEDYEIDTYVEPNVDVGRVVSGIEGGDYIGLTICMPSQSGSYEFRKDQICVKNLDPELDWHYRYTHNLHVAHKTGCDMTVVAPILAACSVLVDEPDNLKGAVLAMRAAEKAREGSHR